MTDIQFHECANIFPFMDSNAFDALRSDLRLNGLSSPIVLHDGKILDGRNRYRAMRQIQPEFSPSSAPGSFTKFSGQSPLAFVVSANLHRRHLNESQRAIIAAKLSLANPGKNRHQQGLSSPKVAALMRVSTGLVNEAKRVIKLDPDKALNVERGSERVGRHAMDGAVSVPLGPELRSQFGLLCDDLHRSNSDVLRELIQRAVNGEIQLLKAETPFVLGRSIGRPKRLT